MSTLQVWKQNFRDEDKCPWPGPVPLTRKQSHLLVGRVEDADRFHRLINEEKRRLILLHAPSGAGKSSFLEAGLAHDLELEGNDVRSVSQWGGYDGEGPRAFLAKKLELAGNDPFEEFGDLGASGVLILDQFEELMRYSPVITHQLFKEILRINRLYLTIIVVSFRSEYLHAFADLERGATNFSVAQMPISEIQGDHALAVAMSGNWGENDEAAEVIDPEAAEWLAKQWVSARLRQSEADGAVIDDPFERIGLLHLQSLLYSLYFTANKAPLTKALVGATLSTWNRGSGRPNESDVDLAKGLSPEDFRTALGRSVDLKLRHCHQAGLTERLVDNQLLSGTRWMVERTVAHLSSGGYKLVRSAPELAVLALGADRDQLRRALKEHGVTTEDEGRLLRAILKMGRVGDSSDREPHASLDAVDSRERPLDLVDVTRRKVAELVDPDPKDHPAASATDECRWGSLLAQPLSEPFENDPNEVTAGYLFGCNPADVLIEEFRRFVFALRWLEESLLVRIATPLAGDPMVSLIHDGFGSALIDWVKVAARDPEGPLSALTAPRGITFEWPQRREGLLLAEPEDNEDQLHGDAGSGQTDARISSLPDGIWAGAHRVLANLRWQNCVIEKTRLERIAFVNCDFQGLALKGCELRGVVFVNCLLDGAHFDDCTFEGNLADLPPGADWSPADPNFVIEVDRDIAAVFRRNLWDQREVIKGGSRTIFCDLPGAAAIPWDGAETETDGTPRTYAISRGEDQVQGRLEVYLVDGGVAVYGGRVSNLLVRHCTFLGTSRLAIRHATGSGLDLVEVLAESKSENRGKSHVEIFGSAIRHLTASSSKNEVGSIKLSVAQAMLAQTYIGTDLRGSVEAVDSSLFHTWNGSPHTEHSPGVKFNAGDCLVHGAIDIAMDDRSRPVGQGPQDERAIEFELPKGFMKKGQTLPERLGRMDFRGNPAKFRADERRTRS